MTFKQHPDLGFEDKKEPLKPTKIQHLEFELEVLKESIIQLENKIFALKNEN